MADDDGSDFLAKYRAMIESRVRKQLERHHTVDPNIDRRRVIELQMRQEQEYLERLIQESEEKAEDTGLLRALMDWLPVLERQLKGR